MITHYIFLVLPCDTENVVTVGWSSLLLPKLGKACVGSLILELKAVRCGPDALLSLLDEFGRRFTKRAVLNTMGFEGELGDIVAAFASITSPFLVTIDDPSVSDVMETGSHAVCTDRKDTSNALRDCAFVYLLVTREALRSKVSFVKVGFSDVFIGRLDATEYRGARVICVRAVSDGRKGEGAVLKAFKAAFEQCLDVGTEYFRGDLGAMVALFEEAAAPWLATSRATRVPRIDLAPEEFVTHYQSLYSTVPQKDMSILLDHIAMWLDVEKAALHKTLRRTYVHGVDYTTNRGPNPHRTPGQRGANNYVRVLTTPDCFKRICMLSRTKNADALRAYFASDRS